MTTQKKLTRSINNRKIAGVCGGLGEYFNVDPLIFRIIFLVLLCGGGSGLLLYLVLWIVMPEDRMNTPYETVQETEFEEVNCKSTPNGFMKKDKGIFWGLLLVAFGLLWLGKSFDFFHFHWCNVLRLWPLLIIWLGISLLPIERIWKNVSSFVILAIAIALIFLLPTRSCCHFFWDDDDFGYEIKRKFKDTECTIKEKINNEITQKEIKISEKINGVIVEGPWEVTITQDDANNSAEIEYNVPHSKVTTEIRSDGYLYIRASSLGCNRNKTLNATIHTASLEIIKGSGAANIKTFGVFPSGCDVTLSGASELSELTCKGDKAKITLSGASTLSDFTLDGNCVEIHLSGASSAEVDVNKKIKGNLSGASTLRYKNAEDVSGISTSGCSKIIHIK